MFEFVRLAIKIVNAGLNKILNIPLVSWLYENKIAPGSKLTTPSLSGLTVGCGACFNLYDQISFPQKSSRNTTELAPLQTHQNSLCPTIEALAADFVDHSRSTSEHSNDFQQRSSPHLKHRYDGTNGRAWFDRQPVKLIWILRVLQELPFIFLQHKETARPLFSGLFEFIQIKPI